MFIGYFDESKKNIAIDDQKSIVMSYVNEHQMNVDIFFSSTDFSSIIDQINSENHTIIVANIACLGSKLEKIKDNLENLMSQKLDLISITEEMHLKSDDTLSEAIDGINLAIKIRSSMVSTITKKALNRKREQGYKLGRDFGYKHYIWEGKEEEIIKKLKSGLSRLKTAKEVGISIVSLYNFLKLYPELKRGAK